MNNNSNCWEITKCGREPGGSKIAKLGVCPATTNSLADGLNGGSHGGRICWGIAGTFCGGKPQGTFAQKQFTCLKCSVYKRVKEEEEEKFVFLHPEKMIDMGF